jgi:UDP-N-acetylmuramyl pentapeptide synthase
MQNNKVFINEQGIIEICVVGDQTVDSVQAMGDRSLTLGRDQKMAGKPVLILDNLLEMGDVPAEARKLVVNLIKSTEYDRFAMLGADSLLRFGANLILQATGKGKRVKYFEDREACLAWLLGQSKLPVAKQ